MRPLFGFLLIVVAGLILAYLTSFLWSAPLAILAWFVVAWAMPKDRDGKTVPLLAWCGIMLLIIVGGVYLRSLL